MFVTAVNISIDVAAAKTVAYQRRLNRTSSMGLKITHQKLEDIAAAVIPAILASETCCAASNWGMTKNAIPVARPTVEFERPISQTGGPGRLDLTQASGDD